METPLVIALTCDDPIAAFAAHELAKYLGKMTGTATTILPSAPGGLTLSLFEDLDDARELPTLADSALDDAIVINTHGVTGLIAGSNPRALLIAVYRFLTELGCRWVRPGADGEVIPQIALAGRRVLVSESASYRHRGLCIEGAVSFENVRDIIDWHPKVGMNSYFTQFREAYTFFDRWYSHEGNPLREKEPFSVERARKLKSATVKEIKKRGMVFHDVGHGWTCEPFGLQGLGWYESPQVPEETAQHLALVNGERKLWGNIAINTNLCYSSNEAREVITEDILHYAGDHPEVDVLHFWLADGSNNQCECDGCRKARPADFYVMMLNELDAKLTRAGLPTRIVFLVYVDLLWPPETQRLVNPERFVLMFAPITRTYSREFSPGADLPELPPYERNRLKFPLSVEANVAFLRAWQEQFKGDSFDFDYHFMWDHYKDPGYCGIADVLSKDTANLGALGLNGLISCQVQRAFFPSGYPMAVMARGLWDKNADQKEIEEDYFRAAFGSDGLRCRDYLCRLSELFDPPYLRGEKDKVSPANAEMLAEVPVVINAFRSTIVRNLDLVQKTQARSWHLLAVHADLCVLLARALQLRAEGHAEEARAAYEKVKTLAWDKEGLTQPALDTFEYTTVLQWLFA